MENTPRRAIALGFFDGVHLGHQALLTKAVERAREHSMEPAVFTFDRSPREFVTGQPVPLLTTVDQRREIIRTCCGIDLVIAEPFDQRMMTMPWTDFLTMLVEKYRAGWLVAGHDYRFGHRNQGDPAHLRQWAADHGLGCDNIPAVTLDGVTVSSSHIRKLLADGNTQEAQRFLGHPLP